MLILSEKKLRRIIREELLDIFNVQPSPQPVLTMRSDAGGEVIMPNYVKERFDKGEIKSLADIV